MPDAPADKTTTLQLLKRAKLHITVSYQFIFSSLFIIVVVIVLDLAVLFIINYTI